MTKLSKEQKDKFKTLSAECKALAAAFDKAIADDEEDGATKAAGADLAFKTIIGKLMDEGNTTAAFMAARMRPNVVTG